MIAMLPRLSLWLLLASCAAAPPAAAPPAPPAPASPAPDGPPPPAEPHRGHHHGQPDKPLGHSFEGDPAVWAARFEGPERDGYQKPAEVVTAMKLAEGMTVADLGTGTGYFVPHLSRAVGASGRVLALDIEPTMVDHVKKRAEREKLSNVEARVVAIDDPGLAEGSVDRILIVNTWHHIPEREAYGEKLRRALERGGEIWVVDFTLETERGPPREHRIAPQQTLAELRAAGLETRLDSELLPDQYIAIGRKR
jgi:SAM-dependent methyltransferase